jgi:hypothetical protein
MSLDWNITAVEDWERKQKEEYQNAVLNVLIWGDLSINMGGIPNTKKGIDEVDFRYRVLDQVGIYLAATEGPDGEKIQYNPTRSDIETWAGLSTNVTPKTRKQFESYLIKRIIRETTDSLRYRKRKAEEEQA